MTPSTASGLPEIVRTKVAQAANPLKLAEVIKGLTKPKAASKEAFIGDVRAALDEEVRLGRAFAYPSAKNEELRYWHRDEKHLLQEKALELATVPLALSALRTKVAKEIKEIKGVDAVFVESVVRAMVGEDQLFEHPGKKGSLFGSSPPPPPLPALEQDKHKKALTKVVTECEKLLKAAGATAEELFRVLRGRLGGETPPKLPETPRQPVPSSMTPEKLGELILQAVQQAPVLSLARLRQQMPASGQGAIFDEAVFLLADTERVIISQDSDPARYSPAEQAEFVRDGDILFTTISRRS